MEMWKMDLDKLSRGDLQTLAKAHGIKANKKNTEIIPELVRHQQALRRDRHMKA